MNGLHVFFLYNGSYRTFSFFCIALLVAIIAKYWVMRNVFGSIVYALIAFVVIDYLTGVMCAIIDKTLSSNVGFKGIFRKVLIFVMVGIGHVIDTQLIGSGDALRTAVIFFYISNEGVSLLENAAHLGLPVPEKIKTVLEQLHDRAESEDK